MHTASFSTLEHLNFSFCCKVEVFCPRVSFTFLLLCFQNKSAQEWWLLVFCLHVYFRFAGTSKKGDWLFWWGKVVQIHNKNNFIYWHTLLHLHSLICSGISCNLDTCVITSTKHTKSKLLGREGSYLSSLLPVCKPDCILWAAPQKLFFLFSPSAVIRSHCNANTAAGSSARGDFLRFSKSFPQDVSGL